MERRELDKQTDQPGEAGGSRQRQQDRNVPAWGHSPWSPPSPRPARGVTAYCQGPPCSLITVSMAISGGNPTKAAVCKHRDPSKSPGRARGERTREWQLGAGTATHLSATRRSS